MKFSACKSVFMETSIIILQVCVCVKAKYEINQVSSSTKEGNHAKIIDDILQQWKINK